ncbi:MAG: sigma-70 family RNA polymerase sigma factor [Dehalococcoidia bacterium]
MESARTTATLSRTTTAGELDFVDRAKRFDADAWNELYDTYFPKMYRYIYVHTGDRDVAEELAAQVFERACEGIHRFRYRGVPLSSWLYRIAHNTMIDWRRRQGNRRVLPMTGDFAGPDPTGRVAARDELARALGYLTREQQQVIVLRHVEGHSTASAGEIMGKKEGAIRSLEFRALAALRRTLIAGGER